MLCALWIRHIRNKHENEVKKRRTYFGLPGQNISLSLNMAAWVLDIMKLNLITTFLLGSSNILYLVHVYLFLREKFYLFAILNIFRTLYVVSNPFVYVLSMRGLKRHYKRLFKRRSSSRVVPMDGRLDQGNID